MNLFKKKTSPVLSNISPVVYTEIDLMYMWLRKEIKFKRIYQIIQSFHTEMGEE